MCGISGFIDRSLMGRTDELQRIAREMAAPLYHRGPDSDGCWTEAQTGLGLSHRRLAIIDLSPGGHQPMCSADGRWVISYNGEIYNFLSLKRELESLGVAFRSDSDTEVALEGCARWGPVDTLTRLNGMFAFSLWDRRERVLYLARDRLGEKPLYYGWAGNTFVFASELKALQRHPQFSVRINRHALSAFFRYGYVPAPLAIFAGVSKLPPASFVKVSLGRTLEISEPEQYWSPGDTVRAAIGNPWEGDVDSAVDELDRVLSRSVGLRMIADVPLGALLSGGIDSSMVVALMQAQSSSPVKSFSVGYEESEYNEATHAQAVASHLGTDHTELYVSSRDAMEVIPDLPRFYDEPFADASQIPTVLISALARRQVTVSLTGDGGDELFGGYNRYVWAPRLWRNARRVPWLIRSGVASVIRSLSPAQWDRGFDWATRVLPFDLRTRRAGENLYKVADVLNARSMHDIYNRLTVSWATPSSLVAGGNDRALPVSSEFLSDDLQRMMFDDLTGYLPDDLLVKVDRASMAASLEVRVPFLDPDVVSFAWRLPAAFKIRGGQGKWLLRRLLHRYVPRALVERPKMGFGVPVGTWLRGPLQEWAASLLDAKRLDAQGLINAQPVTRKWQEHCTGRGNWQYQLWAVLMFQAWLNELPSIPDIEG